MTTQPQPVAVDVDALVLEAAIRCRRDPVEYARLAYPWRFPGELEQHAGLDDWQAGVLDHLGEKLRAGASPIKVAIASGHGVGKSALMSIIIDWALTTFEDARGVITANTEPQLRTKTWPEVAKWRRLSIAAPLFRVREMSIEAATERRRRSWRLDRIAWSEHNSEAFAGLHNLGKRILLIFDEASAIADAIWDVAAGALTDRETEIIWIVCGNPTRATGRFRECFRSGSDWHTVHVDARKSRLTNHEQLAEWAERYGEDSDFYRVRVRGEFPRVSAQQFIGSDVVFGARRREARSMTADPIIVGIDFARGGDCETVLVRRKGFDARTLPALRWRERDSSKLVDAILAVRVEDRRRGLEWDYCFGDDTGLGGPIIDHLRRRGLRIEGIRNGDPAGSKDYGNRAAEMMGGVRDWLAAGGAIEDSPELDEQLTQREYSLDSKGRIVLTPKDQMRAAGIASPDWAEALALTFAAPVLRRAEVAQPTAPVMPTRDEYRPLETGGNRSRGGYAPLGR